MVSSQPSFMPRFSAAMEGWRIQVCRRLRDSSWRLSISAKMGSRSEAGGAGAAAAVQRGSASAAAPAAAVCRKVLRSVIFLSLRGHFVLNQLGRETTLFAAVAANFAKENMRIRPWRKSEGQFRGPRFARGLVGPPGFEPGTNGL